MILPSARLAPRMRQWPKNQHALENPRARFNLNDQPENLGRSTRRVHGPFSMRFPKTKWDGMSLWFQFGTGEDGSPELRNMDPP